MKKKTKILYTLLLGIMIIPTTVAIVSCSSNATSNDLNQSDFSTKLKELYQPWYDSLTDGPWNKNNNEFENYFCNSEQQAIGLYSWNGGVFWNELLHRGWTLEKDKMNKQIFNLQFENPPMDLKNPHEVQFSDYTFLESALSKAIAPIDMTVYHGVEYMEIEFYDQLKDFIISTPSGYDYSQCVNKTITSKGFISTSLIKSYTTNFFDWRPSYVWNTDLKSNPLLEPVVFKINVKKDSRGVAFLSNFDFAGFGTGSKEEQVLINLNCQFKITNVYKELNQNNEKINIFEVDLI